MQQDVGQLGLERVAVLDGREVPARAAPVGDRARHTTDHLLDGVLAQRRVELAAEVLLGDDVRRVLRPRLRKLDAALLEGDAVAVGDAGIAQFPLDGVERLDAGLREEPGNGQRLACLDVGHEWGLRSALHRPAPLISPRGFVLFAACRLRSGGRRFLRLVSDGTRVRRAAGRLAPFYRARPRKSRCQQAKNRPRSGDLTQRGRAAFNRGKRSQGAAMDLHLEGKVAVVTGATKGIGLAVTRTLLQEGAHVVASSRTRTPEFDAIAGEARNLLHVKADLADPAAPAEIIARALEAFGGLDILVNNAGGPPPGTKLAALRLPRPDRRRVARDARLQPHQRCARMPRRDPAARRTRRRQHHQHHLRPRPTAVGDQRALRRGEGARSRT